MSLDFEQDWSVDLTLEYERGQPEGDGIAMDTIRMQHIIRSNSAHEAVNDTVGFAREFYKLKIERVTVTRIDIMLVSERE